MNHREAIERVIGTTTLHDAIDHAVAHPEDSPIAPIERGLAPGGLVFRVLIDGEIAHETKGTRESEALGAYAEEAAQMAIDAALAGKRVELRVYDGDSGGWVFSRQVIAR